MGLLVDFAPQDGHFSRGVHHQPEVPVDLGHLDDDPVVAVLEYDIFTSVSSQ